MITRLFWILSVAEFVAIGTVTLLILTNTWKSGPGGPVGAILLFIPLLAIAVAWVSVYFWGSVAVAQVFLALHALILVWQLYAGARNLAQSYKLAHYRLGDDDFRGPQRELAHAILDRDLARVRQLLPAAGELNKIYGADTLLNFAVGNANRDQDVEIVKALLDAGADPNYPPDASPLSKADSGNQPAMYELLLSAGANPNVINSEGQPIWWASINRQFGFRIEILRSLLDHGADLALRDSESGPIGYAAQQSQWPAVLLLMERGASWKDDRRDGKSLAEMVGLAFQTTSTPSEELKIIHAKLHTE